MLENKIYQARLDVGFKLEEDIEKVNKLCNYISCFFPDLSGSINDFALDQPYLFYSSSSENYLHLLKKDVEKKGYVKNTEIYSLFPQLAEDY